MFYSVLYLQVLSPRSLSLSSWILLSGFQTTFSCYSLCNLVFVASRRCNLSYLALTLLWFSLAIQIILLQFVGSSQLACFDYFVGFFFYSDDLLYFFLAWFLFDSSINDDIYALLLSVFSSHFISNPPPNICIRSST